jgi:hypothetical protein
MRHRSHAPSSDSEESKVSAAAGIWRRLDASVKIMSGAVRASPAVSAIGRRKLVAMTIAVLMTIAPVASDAATFQYFRMFGGGQGGTVVSPPTPAGTISYSVAGPATATVGMPYSASASVAGAVGAAVFSMFSGSFPPGLSLNGAYIPLSFKRGGISVEGPVPTGRFSADPFLITLLQLMGTGRCLSRHRATPVGAALFWSSGT